MTVEKREEVGGSGEKPDPAEEGEEYEEDRGGGRGGEEGEREEGGCCQLEEGFEAVGHPPLTLGDPLLEGCHLVNQSSSASHIHPPNLHQGHLEERRVDESEDRRFPRYQSPCWQPCLGAVIIVMGIIYHDCDHENRDYDHDYDS